MCDFLDGVAEVKKKRREKRVEITTNDPRGKEGDEQKKPI